MVLSKDQILNAKDLHTETVDVPEWGGEVMIRVMRGVDRDAFENLCARHKGIQNVPNVFARLCGMCICDDAGNRLFSEKEIDALGQRSCVALGKVWDAAIRLNRLNADEIESAEKNSEAAPSG